MFNWVIGWSIRNRVAVLLLYILLVVTAAFVVGHMKVDVFPEFAPPQVQIQTEAPGFSSHDVEVLVTRPIEVALQGAPNVEQIRSNSSVGLSRITIVFKWGVEIFRARQIIQERLQLVQSSLPASVNAPQLMPVTSAVSWLLKFALVDWSAKFREHELRGLVDWDFRNRLLSQPGVASVTAVGGGVKQYQVMMDPLKMQKFGVTSEEVIQAARSANAVAPGGFVYPSREEEYLVRVNGVVKNYGDLNSTVVAIRERQPIRLEDVAEARFGSEIKRGDGQIYGGPAVVATVSKLWGADTLESTRRVEAVLKELGASLPKDVELIPNVFRQATFIESSVHNLKESLYTSCLIVAFVLILFLMRWQPTLISLVAIPTSLLAGVFILWLLDVGINALTLGGLVFAIGEVVDDAIIDVENIMRRLHENKQAAHPASALEIVYEGSREIRNSVVFATLIVAIAFMPIFFLEGIEGRIFRPLAIAYLAAIASSLVVAITLVPVLCYYLMGRNSARLSLGVSPATAFLLAQYRRLLTPCLRRPAWWMAALLLVPLAVALWLVPGLGRSFMPSFHEGNIVVAATLLPGASLDESLRVGKEVDKLIGTMPQVASIVQRAGRSPLDEDAQPVNFSEYDIALKPGVQNTTDVIHAIREKLASIPGMAVNVSQFITHRMSEIFSGIRAQVVIKIYGQDLSVLQAKQQEILRAVKDVPGVVDLQAEPMILVPVVDIRVDREKAAIYGFTPGQIVSRAGQALNGIAVSKVLENDRAFDLYVRIDDQSRSNIEALGALPLSSPTGALVALRDVARLEVVQEPYMINRDGGARRAIVQWNTDGRDLNAVVEDARARIAKISLPSGYSVEIGGDYEGQQRATRNLLISGGAAIVLMAVTMYQAFRRWSATLLIMLNLPLALIGGVFALKLSGETLNVSSLIGMVALFGVATRNSILLMSRFQVLLLEKPGTPIAQIALQGALDRLLPILMTACAAALAVIPLIIGDPAGKELERPLAIVLLGGMMTSTLLNLFVIPTLFNWMASRSTESFTQQDA